MDQALKLVSTGGARFIAVDTSASGTATGSLGTDSRILVLLKSQVVKPLVLNNRYLLNALSHLAFIPGSPRPGFDAKM